VHKILTLALSAIVFGQAAPAPAAPPLQLPTPPGEAWRVIQGYGCGTHESGELYALDLVRADGPSLGAPVRAAAGGTVTAWVEPSGTLIIDHGGGFFTQYTHMEPFGMPQRGQLVARGAPVGYVGERGAPGNPHLHFMLFTGGGFGGREGRRSLPVSFVEGFDLADIGGCSQHQGELLTAAGAPRAYTRGSVPLYAREERVYCPEWPGLCAL
jgi:murein DD-endopeptidase MepM/ murein hydrolase activator NlpD